MKQIIEATIKKTIDKLDLESVNFQVEHPEDLSHGDYACNVAMVAGGGRELAEKIVHKLSETTLQKMVKKIEVAGPGFINITIQNDALVSHVNKVLRDEFEKKSQWGKKVMVEYAHPNTHKQFHIGHLRNIALGESICKLLEAVGIRVIRVNYQGDVGLHIAKAIWGLNKDKVGYKKVKNKPELDKVEFLGQAYAKGAQAYEASSKAKKEIIEFNHQIFSGKGEVIDLWRETRQWSLDFFELIYNRVGTKYDRLYFESEGNDGLEIAKKALKKGILTKSKGAIVFKGEKYGLDTRVFINAQGLPTYEAKELALAPKEFSEFGEIDKCIHVVGPEQESFFKVTFKVEELLDDKTFKDKQHHRVYAFVNLKKGKMSSRLGKVVTGWRLLEEAKNKIKKLYKVSDELAEKIGVGAVKYAFLKVSPMQEIKYDLEESVSLNGNSGPYLQYTYARAKSVLKKAGKLSLQGESLKWIKVDQLERELLQILSRFDEAVILAAQELAPNIMANFLYQLAQKYNSFYNKCPIKQDKNRLWLTQATAKELKQGLGLLGIKCPEKM